MNLTETCQKLTETTDAAEAIDLINNLPSEDGAVAYNFGAMVFKNRGAFYREAHKRVREGDEKALALKHYAQSILDTPKANEALSQALKIADEIGVEIPDRSTWEEVGTS